MEHSVVSEEIALTREICRILTTSTFARTFLTFDPEDNLDSRHGSSGNRFNGGYMRFGLAFATRPN